MIFYKFIGGASRDSRDARLKLERVLQLARWLILTMSFAKILFSWFRIAKYCEIYIRSIFLERKIVISIIINDDDLLTAQYFLKKFVKIESNNSFGIFIFPIILSHTYILSLFYSYLMSLFQYNRAVNFVYKIHDTKNKEPRTKPLYCLYCGWGIYIYICYDHAKTSTSSVPH